MKDIICGFIIAALICVQPWNAYGEPRSRGETFQTARSIHIKANDQFGNSVDTHAAWSAVSLEVLEEYYGQVMNSIKENAPAPTILVLESQTDQIRRLQAISKQYKKPAKIRLVPDGLYKELAQAYPTLGIELAQAPLFGITPGTKKLFVRPTRSDLYVGGIVTVLGGLVTYNAMVLGSGLDPDVVFKILAFQSATVALFQIGHTTVDNLFEFRFGFSKNPVSRAEQLFFRTLWEALSKSFIRSIVGPVGSAHDISTDLGKIEVGQNVAANASGAIPYYLTRNGVFKQGDLRWEARRLWWGVNAYLPGLFFSFKDQLGQSGSILFRVHYGIGEGVNIYASTLEIMGFYLLGVGFLISFPRFAEAIADIEQAIFESAAGFLRQCGQKLGLLKKGKG